MPNIQLAKPAQKSLASTLGGGSPGATIGARARLAALRATRTLIQGVAASFGTGAAGATLLTATYWEAFGVSVIGALITAVIPFAQNVAAFLPPDPTQSPPGAPVEGPMALRSAVGGPVR